jgi:hypothetical protein
MPMRQSRRPFIGATCLGLAMAISIGWTNAATAAGGHGPLRPDRSPALRHVADDIPPPTPVTEDQQARIRAEVQKIPAAELQLENIVGSVYDAILNANYAALTPAKKAYLKERVRQTVEAWKQTHSGADATDRDAVGELLIKIAGVGVAVDLIVPAVQKVRETERASPQGAAPEHPVTIERRR